MVVFLEDRSRRRTFQVFIKEALPKAGESARTLVAFLIETTIDESCRVTPGISRSLESKTLTCFCTSDLIIDVIF